MRKGISMSLADAAAHQARHGFGKGPLSSPKAPEPVKLPKSRQNATEREYGLILEAMKQRGEIVDYRPFGIRLEWGADPKTEKPMVYSPDFVVWTSQPTEEVSFREVKGGYIRPQDWIRFKGCRSEWPQFDFQLHQKANGEWRRLL
jgi:hypothetical protein